MSQSNAIRTEVTRSKIELTRIYVAEFQKADSKTAELKQVIKTVSYYPSKRVDSNMQDNLFAASEFGYDEQPFESIETRMAWIIIPEAMSEAELLRRLEIANANGGVIYRVLSNEPILDNNQLFSITQGLRTKNQFANKQIVRYPESHDTRPNEVIKDRSGNVQYRRTFFWSTPKEDVDQRDPAKVYVTPEVLAELEGAQVIGGQTL